MTEYLLRVFFLSVFATWPFIGIMVVVLRFKPETYGGLLACVVWGAMTGWLAVLAEVINWVLWHPLWDRRLRK